MRHSRTEELDTQATCESQTCPACSEADFDTPKVVWVACSHCNTWYHVACIRLKNVEDYEKWYCASCLANTHLGLAPKMRPPLRRSNREKPATDYAAIQDGKPSDPLARWSLLLSQYDDWPERVRRVSGACWTTDWLANTNNALESPVLAPAHAEDCMNPGSHIPGMRMPPRHTTIRDVARLVGPNTHVEVIDVGTQMSSRAWTLEMWADYFETPASRREKLLNVISLEITGTPLQAMVEAPLMVRENDWVERDWPLNRRPCHEDANKWPKVQRYVLMGVQGAFTDFHIDFAATLVYYHVVWGHKRFLFAPPTSANLAAYRAWTSSARQESEWLGYALQNLTRVDIHTGETMLIPAGWIHAVSTLEDTLVIGGNFLTDYQVSMHWRIEEMEVATHVPRKFRFPHLMRLAWYVAHGWYERLESVVKDEDHQKDVHDHKHTSNACAVVLTPRVIDGIQQLCKRLGAEIHKLETQAPSSKGYKAAHEAVPRDVVKDPKALLEALRAQLEARTSMRKRRRRR